MESGEFIFIKKLNSFKPKVRTGSAGGRKKMTTLNMSGETKSRIEKRVENAKKMVEEMKSEIENAENLADLRNATKDARLF